MNRAVDLQTSSHAAAESFYLPDGEEQRRRDADYGSCCGRCRGARASRSGNTMSALRCVRVDRGGGGGAERPGLTATVGRGCARGARVTARARSVPAVHSRRPRRAACHWRHNQGAFCGCRRFQAVDCHSGHRIWAATGVPPASSRDLGVGARFAGVRGAGRARSVPRQPAGGGRLGVGQAAGAPAAPDDAAAALRRAAPIGRRRPRHPFAATISTVCHEHPPGAHVAPAVRV